MEKQNEQFLENLSVCNKFEEFISSQTKNMNIFDSLVDIAGKKNHKIKC